MASSVKWIQAFVVMLLLFVLINKLPVHSITKQQQKPDPIVQQSRF